MRSPEVHPDDRVTFRLLAPQATEVLLRGEFIGAQERVALAKDPDGVWSVTAGPLRPDMHWYHSKSIGKARRLHVYTPPAYEKDVRTRYPVLYLLHGSGDTDGEWTSVGRANHVLDNLLAEGKARPMLIVMPDGHATDPNATDPATRGQNTAKFEQDLLGDIIPLIESSYRVAPGSQNRALAGLSMGGAQTINIGLSHPDRFGWMGVFSAGAGFGPNAAQEFEEKYKGVLGAPERFHKQVQLLWIGCGRTDGLLKSAHQLSSTLKKYGIRHTFRETDGAHVWWLWRKYLAELAPQLFRKAT
ncbi:MAG: hypothetical protein HY235_00635 [Acidobacteria bacterium]|nr:hypothetical protein [Acidobacteriota bacterium]